jgi:predicted NAD/FAD-dependent oxidoreductase
MPTLPAGKARAISGDNASRRRDALWIDCEACFFKFDARTDLED